MRQIIKERKIGLIIILLTTLATALYVSLFMFPKPDMFILPIIGVALLLMWYSGIRLFFNPKWGEE
jgi:hypothetical protein